MLGQEITDGRRHDIGKMMFAFSIFWMYLFWSQYLVIYYGNLPEETYFIRDRLGDQFMIDQGYSAAAFAAATAASRCARGTSMRVGALHDWPLLSIM